MVCKFQVSSCIIGIKVFLCPEQGKYSKGRDFWTCVTYKMVCALMKQNYFRAHPKVSLEVKLCAALCSHSLFTFWNRCEFEQKSNGEIREIRQYNHGPYRNFTLGREGGPYNRELISYTAMKRIFKGLFLR